MGANVSTRIFHRTSERIVQADYWLSRQCSAYFICRLFKMFVPGRDLVGRLSINTAKQAQRIGHYDHADNQR